MRDPGERGATGFALLVAAALLFVVPAESATRQRTHAVATQFTLYFSLAPDRSSKLTLANRTVRVDIYVFVLPATGVDRVRFFLDDAAMAGTPRAIDTAAPYDFEGTAVDGAALPFDTVPLADGSHTITAAIDVAAGGTQVVNATFTTLNDKPWLVLLPDRLGLSLAVGDAPASTPGRLEATDGSDGPYTLTDKASWLKASPASGPLPASLSLTVDPAGLAPGSYSTTLVAKADGYVLDKLKVTLVLAGSGPFRVNFQSDTAPVPAGYVRDFGQAFGLRRSANQGTGLEYGWVDAVSGAPRSLVGNGRDRNRAGVAQRLDTLIHVQGIDASEEVRVLKAGAWELHVSNGTYQVTVSVGDGPPYDSAHTVNVEGSTVLDRYAGNGAQEYRQATALARVLDGRITLDAAGGTNTKFNYVDVDAAPGASDRPSVTLVSPATGAIGVLRTTPVSVDVHLPNAGSGVDPATVSSANVRLVRADDRAPVTANVNTSGGGDAIVLQPTEPLAASTRYRFELGEGVADTTGAAFLPFASTFTTGPEGGGGGGTIVFEQVQQPVSGGKTYTSLAVSPDGRLYASTLDGMILRFTIEPDGDLGVPEVITSLQEANGGPRLLIGLAFDPASTPASPVLWVTHTEFVFDQAPDWTAKISRLSGGGLETVQDVIVGLPRSTKGHVTNSLAFGPDGALYVLQGSNTAAGAPSSAWQFREESFLTAALLRVDLAAIASPPLDVRTAEGGGTYDPLAPGAPLTLFATGIRNAYDLVWHTNGHLYVPTNGAGTGGGTPGSPSPLPPACGRRIDGEYTEPAVPGLASTGVAQPDFLFRIDEGGYYGHPNPARCEWVLNGGNPTSGPDTAQVAAYPVGVKPDRNWRGFAYDFGLHYSPDGAIEYGGDAFGGVLRGRLMIVRHSAGDDVIVLRLAPDGDVVEGLTGIQGLTGFADPLDLAEDPATGNLYVAEYGAQKITLVRPLG